MGCDIGELRLSFSHGGASARACHQPQDSPKSLGIKIPQSLLLRADEVIQ